MENDIINRLKELFEENIIEDNTKNVIINIYIGETNHV